MWKAIGGVDIFLTAEIADAALLEPASVTTYFVSVMV